MAHNIITAIQEARTLLYKLESIKRSPGTDWFIIAEISNKLQTYNHQLDNLALTCTRRKELK